MAHTLVGLFNNETQAKNAMNALIANGIQEDYIRSSPEEMENEHDERSGGGITGFFRSLFGQDDHLVNAYSDAVHKGHTMVTVEVDDDAQNQRAIEVLNQFDPIDIEADVGQATSHSMQNASAAKAQGRPQQDTGTHIPVIQEEIAVGKRAVEHGGVRIIQRVRSQPVEESVRLREEHVHVERRPVNQEVSNDQVDALKDQTYELKETVEEAVVSKKARVVEEVVVNKDVSEHTETIKDTVRRTEVEIENLDTTSGKAPKTPKKSR